MILRTVIEMAPGTGRIHGAQLRLTHRLKNKGNRSSLSKSFAQFEFSDNSPVAGDIGPLKVIEQLFTLTNQL